MAATSEEPNKLHIAMFPWLAFGHIIPFLELSKLIAQKGHRISFISTSRNIDRLPKIPPNLAPQMTMVKLNLPIEENLPPNAEATMDAPHHKHPYLKKAYDRLEQPLAHFLETTSPDWIIYDFAPHWLPPIAAKLGISRAFFSIFTALTLSFLEPSVVKETYDPRTEPEHFTVPPRWIPFPNNVAFRMSEVKRIFEGNDEEVSGVSDFFRLASVFLGSEAIFVRSSMEVEPEFLKLVEELHQKPVVPVGLILPPSAKFNADEEKDENWVQIKEFLDKQQKGLVVYIAFGTEVTPNQKELTELALGLELSGLPFFWVLNKGHSSIDLPKEFEFRTKDRGLVWTSWAPQLRILGHEAVGGLLTHCGRSSIIEALHFGHALISLPFWSDQGLNERTLEWKKIGFGIPRNEDDGSFTRESVSAALRLVMVEEEGRIYRDGAWEMKKMFGDRKREEEYLDDFVEFLHRHRSLHKS